MGELMAFNCRHIAVYFLSPSTSDNRELSGDLRKERKMAKYTRAPWKFENNLGCKTIKGAKSGTSRQARYLEIAYTVGLANEKVDKANARLMAAAPQLLEACKTLREQLIWCSGSGDFGPGGQAHEGWQKGVVPALEASKAAIAAAEGE